MKVRSSKDEAQVPIHQAKSDQDFLEALEEKLVLVRDRVRSVAGRYTIGFFPWGSGGTAKSFTMIEEFGDKPNNQGYHGPNGKASNDH